MGIKNFDQFILEDRRYYDRDQGYGPLKGKLSVFKDRERSSNIGNWLEDIKGRVKTEMRARKDAPGKTKNAGDPLRVLGSLSGFLLNLGAGVSDALFGSTKKGEGYRKRSKEELERWERKTFSGDARKVTDKDAANFYMNGVERGKKIFGKDFDPDNPKTDEERRYAEDLYDATSRYYGRINNSKK